MMNFDLAILQNFVHHSLPLFILCLGGLLCLLLEAIWPRKFGGFIFSLGLSSVVLALISLWGLWEGNFVSGGNFPPRALLVWDPLTLYFSLLTLVVGGITFLISWSYVRVHPHLAAEISVLLLFSIVGMILMFASDHLIISFLGLETMSLAVYVLVGSHKRDLKSNEASVKYFLMGSVASAVFLYGLVFLYGRFETFHLSHFTVLAAQQTGEPYLYVGLALLFTGLLFKVAVVPFHFWAPDVYEGAPAPVTGFMATGVKLAAFAFFIRIFLSMNQFMTGAGEFLGNIAAVTLIVGSLLAAVQTNFKRLLAYSSVTHAGFLLLAFYSDLSLNLPTTRGAQAMAFYLAAYSAMSLGAFAVLSQMTKDNSEASDLADLRGLGQAHPLLAVVLALFLFAMAGIPPLAGFIAKYGVISVLVQNGTYGLAIIAVLTSVIGAFFYLRPIVYMFMSDDKSPRAVPSLPLTAVVAISICAFLVVILGLAPGVVMKFSQLAVAAIK